MRAFIAGGTGFVGVNLANRLAERGWQVVVMGHTADRPRGLALPVEVVAGDGRRPGPWQGRVSGSALVVNLAGATIFSR
jgi:nucleoside-diphosphate-sugar epimerase